MNIVEAILIDKKKYNILISGYLWWDLTKIFAETLANNLKFDLVIADQIIPTNKLIKHSDEINFVKLNSDVKSMIDNYKKNDIKKGIIILGYTFPPEKIEFPVDFHININANPILQTSIIVDLIKSKGFTRMDVDVHISYLSKSWKNNKINKFLTMPQNYNEILDQLYTQAFDSVMDNISKKVYGEKYDEIKNAKEPEKYPLPPEGKDTTIVADQSKLSVKENVLKYTGENIAQFNSDLDDIIIKSDNEEDDEEDNEEDGNDELNIKNPVLVQNDYDVYSFVNNSIEEEDVKTDMEKKELLKNDNLRDQDGGIINKTKIKNNYTNLPYYIGRRKIK